MKVKIAGILPFPSPPPSLAPPCLSKENEVVVDNLDALVLIHIYSRRVYTVNAPTIHMHVGNDGTAQFEVRAVYASQKDLGSTLESGQAYGPCLFSPSTNFTVGM